MEFLYRVTAARIGMLTDGPTAEEAEALEQHASYLAALTQRGILQLAGRTQTTDSNTFGVVVFLAADEGEARRIMNEDPAVREGIMRAELFPFKIAFSGSRLGA